MTRRRREAFEEVDHYQVVQDISVGGANEKDVLQDPDSGAKYIAKLGRRHNDLEVMTEYAIYLIGRSLGVIVAEAKIARYRGRLRFLSKYFLSEREELVHGMQLFKELYDELTVQEVLGKEAQEQAMFSVQAVKDAFGAHYLKDEADLFRRFTSMLAHDALIGVQDRHHQNWGVVVQRTVAGPAPRFAPLYDSARGLFCNTVDVDIRRYIGRAGEQRLDGYVARARPLVGFNGLSPKAGRRCVTHDQLLAAVFDAFPETRSGISAVLDAYDWRKVRSELSRELGSLCSAQRIQLMLTCLRRRLRSIRRAINAKVSGADILGR